MSDNRRYVATAVIVTKIEAVTILASLIFKELRAREAQRHVRFAPRELPKHRFFFLIHNKRNMLAIISVVLTILVVVFVNYLQTSFVINVDVCVNNSDKSTRFMYLLIV